MSQPLNIDNLNYFVGKVVTFLTPPINRPLQDRDILSYMLGRVTKIDSAGIWFEHLQTKNLNFIFFQNIISIAEEQVVLKEENELTKENETLSVQKIRKAISS
jgi:hypothetical protein